MAPLIQDADVAAVASAMEWRLFVRWQGQSRGPVAGLMRSATLQALQTESKIVLRVARPKR